MKNKRAITFLFLANTVTGISQGISLISIAWFVSNTLERPALFGLMFLTATSFSIPWGIYAGTLVDRYDRKTIMLFIQAFGFLAVFTAAISGELIKLRNSIDALLTGFSL